MNMQEIFDTVAKHLLAQGEKAANAGGNCLYRTQKDEKVLKCAAGCLIPDEEYNIYMEDNIPRALSFFKKNFTLEQQDLINALQTMHDHEEVDVWPEELSDIAASFELSDSAIKLFAERNP